MSYIQNQTSGHFAGKSGEQVQKDFIKGDTVIAKVDVLPNLKKDKGYKILDFCSSYYNLNFNCFKIKSNNELPRH